MAGLIRIQASPALARAGLTQIVVTPSGAARLSNNEKVEFAIPADPVSDWFDTTCDLSCHAGHRLQLWADGFLLTDRSLGISAEIDRCDDYGVTAWASRLDGGPVPAANFLLDGVDIGLMHASLPESGSLFARNGSVMLHRALPAAALDGRTHELCIAIAGVTIATQTWRAMPRFTASRAQDGAISLHFVDPASSGRPVTLTATALPSGLEVARTHLHQSVSTSVRWAIPTGQDAIVLRAGIAGQIEIATLHATTRARRIAATRARARVMLHARRDFSAPESWEAALPDRSSWQPEIAGAAPCLVVCGRGAGVSVVVPVHGGTLETHRCLTALVAAMRDGDAIDEIIVVDDASPDPVMAEILLAHQDHAGPSALRIIRLAQNAGFAASVNAGIAAATPGNDVIVLNADTIVPRGFAARLRAACHADPDTATATALSNDATILSLPNAQGGNLLSPHEALALDAALKQARHEPIEIPTGIGFCLFIRRAAWLDAGPFSTRWGRGYCEEVDWCLRARDRGWRHVAACDTLVFHHGCVSFGAAERRTHLARNQPILDRLYPEYDAEIRAFLRTDPMQARRVEAFCHLLKAAARPCLLHFTHAMGGGTAVLVEALAAGFEAEGGMNLICARIHDNFRGEDVFTITWRERGLELRLPHRAIVSFTDGMVASGLPAIRAIIHSLTGVGPAIREIVANAGLPYLVYIHDYQWLCPRIVLVDQSGSHCGQPSPRYCELCVRANPIYDFAEEDSLIRTNLGEWIGANADLLRRAVAVIAPSRDSHTRIAARFGLENMHRAAHPERVPDCEITRRGDDDRVLRIAVTGGLSVQKGRDVIARLAALIDARRAPVQIAVFGAVEEPSILSHFACVTLAGPYESCDLKRHLAAFHPHFVFFPAVWPETWCFTLSEVWACGYAAVSFDIGAIAERIRDSRAGAVLPFGLTADALLQALPDARDAVSCLFGHRFSLVAEGQIAPLKLLFSVDS